MAVLDIQITNASLQYIQGGIAASIDEGSWISTAYLMAEIVIIPLTSFLAAVFSLRRYLVATAIGFVVFSILCGLASNLTMMILCRIGQGLTGGALIPTALSIVLTCLPKSKQPMGLALFGFTATFAPAIGPTVGGWLTITYSWHYIFYVNVLPGAVLVWAVWYGLAQAKPDYARLWRADWLGIATMAIGLGCLIAVLEEGERKAWFTTEWIRWASIAAAICIPLAVILELTRKEPFIELRLLANRGLGPASVIALLLGFGLYGTVYVLPVYLGQIQHYDAMQIGEVVMWMGLPQLAILPFVPMAMKRIDARWLVAFGLALFAASNLMNAYMSHDTGLPQLKWPQLVRALGQPFIIVPLSQLATAPLRADQQGQGSAIFNIMRNLGGSIGIALLSSFITIREHFHFSVIADHVTPNVPAVQARIAAMTQALAPHGGSVTAHAQAIEMLRDTVRREAFVMAYSDCFFIIGVGMALAIAALFLVPKPRADASAHPG
ncbi:MAG: DHA2 family efflux MFS transporter permease subunit [Alphaproteobacteria bacterium]|nr:DHA2 family efflux MFS transporter permease subunit [Alphaproteobacteria bacterium]